MSLTISEAIGAFERAFRARNPNEIERILRENLNVQVAVIESVESTENKINEGYYPLTIRVPYWIFISKVKEKGELKLRVYSLESLEQENIISEEGKKWKLQEIYSPSDLLPFKTYFLLKDEAGYHPDLGLTFEGNGEVTGFEKINRSEKAEKFGIGREQTWEEHAIGSYKRADRILKIYRPFLVDWAKNIFSIQNLSEEQIEETVDAIILAIKISALLHDIGKLRKEWQESVGWKEGQPYIARTSNIQRIFSIPHARYAYSFLKTMLRNLLIDEEDKSGYRFIDHIALATARHHSLEATGKVEPNKFQLADENVANFLSNLLSENVSEIKEYDLDKLIRNCIEETNKGSLMDEPPTPSDDFYLIYTIANRVVKFADWEDAGGEIIELPEIKGGGNDA